MAKRLTTLLAILLGTMLLAAPAFSGDIAPSVRAWTATAGEGETIAVWVFFKDKGIFETRALELAISDLPLYYPPRTVERRLAARPGRPFDAADLHLYIPYVQALEAEGVEFRAFSRWLNAVSIYATSDEIARIAGMPFVRSISRVGGRRGGPEPVTVKVPRPAPTLDQYGASYTQLAQIQVTDLQAEGLTGEGVVVAIFDTGFWREHEAIAGVNVVAEHDFINDDDITANEPGDDPYQHYHGTMCLSLLAGYVPGLLMGAAYGADYILAKTEDITMEQPIEEDWWIEAAEWADSLGANVISSSLCYNDWYTYEDMDGDTAPITIAADRAAVNGIAVVNAAGNSGSSSWRYILAPADGDSVITAGAVDSTGTRANFSSQGPTYDGRIKPTVMAMGLDDLIADPLDAHSYRRGSGTSFACPLVAGAVALILEKNPGWASPQVIEALMATGTRASNPDTLYGWGILQAYDASEYSPISGIVSGREAPVLLAYPNPCASDLTIRCPEGRPCPKICLYDVRGRLLETVIPNESGIVTLDMGGMDLRLSSGVVFVVAPPAKPAKVLVLR
jgi:serine protease AprX